MGLLTSVEWYIWLYKAMRDLSCTQVQRMYSDLTCLQIYDTHDSTEQVCHTGSSRLHIYDRISTPFLNVLANCEYQDSVKPKQS